MAHRNMLKMMSQSAGLRLAVLCCVAVLGILALLPTNDRAVLVLKGASVSGWCLPAILIGAAIGFLAWNTRAWLIVTGVLLSLTFVLYLDSDRIRQWSDCDDFQEALSKQDPALITAINAYNKSTAPTVMYSGYTGSPELWQRDLHATAALLEQFSGEIELLTRGQKRGCFGIHAQALQAKLEKRVHGFEKLSKNRKILMENQPTGVWANVDDTLPVSIPPGLTAGK